MAKSEATWLGTFSGSARRVMNAPLHGPPPRSVTLKSMVGAPHSPHARHEPGRSFLVSQVVRPEGLDEHVLFDMNATDER